MAQGKTYTTKICPSSKEASDALGDLTQQLNRNVTPDKGKITFTQFAKLFLEKYITTKKGNDHATNYTIESRIRNQLVPFIGHMKLKDINGEVVQDLINCLRKKYMPSSAQTAFVNRDTRLYGNTTFRVFRPYERKDSF